METLKTKKNQKGVILLMTLLILSSILVVTLGAANLVMAGIKMNRLTGYSSIAFYAAEAGLERALFEARKNSSFTSPINANLVNGSSYIVTYTKVGSNNTFKSVGSFKSVKRMVESVYED